LALYLSKMLALHVAPNVLGLSGAALLTPPAARHADAVTANSTAADATAADATACEACRRSVLFDRRQASKLCRGLVGLTGVGSLYQNGLHEAPLPSEAHFPPTQAWRATLTSSAARVLYAPRPQGAGEGSAHLSRGGATVPMPKQARSHQGAPRGSPEKWSPRAKIAATSQQPVHFGRSWLPWSYTLQRPVFASPLPQ
jgi:hypothetical protein